MTGTAIDLAGLEERYNTLKRDADADPWNFQQDEDLIGLVITDFPALIATTRATAAERDRLKVMNKGLADSLEDMITRFERCMVVGGTDAEFARCATAEARAVLDEARRS